MPQPPMDSAQCSAYDVQLFDCTKKTRVFLSTGKEIVAKNFQIEREISNLECNTVYTKAIFWKKLLYYFVIHPPVFRGEWGVVVVAVR